MMCQLCLTLIGRQPSPRGLAITSTIKKDKESHNLNVVRSVFNSSIILATSSQFQPHLLQMGIAQIIFSRTQPISSVKVTQ
ncbi:hypothetical protein PanWU01x14_303850, partial [Parasponia andersonii]